MAPKLSRGGNQVIFQGKALIIFFGFLYSSFEIPAQAGKLINVASSRVTLAFLSRFLKLA